MSFEIETTKEESKRHTIVDFILITIAVIFVLIAVGFREGMFI